MPASNKNAPYKKYQCRYFDECGQPINSGCNQGDDCRFVHPNDFNWPGLKCRPLVSSVTRRKNTQPSRARSDLENRSHRLSVDSAHSARPGVPLVSQADLFRRCKIESKDVHLDYGDSDNGLNTSYTTSSRSFSDRYRYPGRDRRNVESDQDEDRRGRSIERPLRRHLSPEATENSSARQTGGYITSAKRGPAEGLSEEHAKNSDEPSRQGDVSIATTAIGYHSEAEVHPPELDAEQAKLRSERFMKMFREVAVVSSQIVQDTVLYDQEERKLQTFNEISATLSKASASAAAAVASPLAEAVLAHARSKERLDSNFQALGKAWEKVFDCLMCEFTRAMEGGIQSALSSIRTEADCLLQKITLESGASKRKVDQASLSPETEGEYSRVHTAKDTELSHSDWGRYALGNFKRRRLADFSRSPSPEFRERSDVKSPSSMSLMEVLNQVKSKIDQQTTSLRSLTKENQELKHQLQTKQFRNSYTALNQRAEPVYAGTPGRSTINESTNKYSSHLRDNSDKRHVGYRDTRFRGESSVSKRRD